MPKRKYPRDDDAMERLDSLRYLKVPVVSDDNTRIALAGWRSEGRVVANRAFMGSKNFLATTQMHFELRGPMPLPYGELKAETVPRIYGPIKTDLGSCLTAALFVVPICSAPETSRWRRNATMIRLRTNLFYLNVMLDSATVTLELIEAPPALWSAGFGSTIVGALMHVAMMSGRDFAVETAYPVTQRMCADVAERVGMQIVEREHEEVADDTRDLLFRPASERSLVLAPVSRVDSKIAATLAGAQCVAALAGVEGMYGEIGVRFREATAADEPFMRMTYAHVWAMKRRGNDVVVIQTVDRVIATMPMPPDGFGPYVASSTA